MKQFEENRRYAFSIGIVILFCAASIFALNYASIRILSAIRAFANVESEYSKGQKEATRSLISYLDSADSYYFRKFEDEIAIPIGDSLARVGLLEGAGKEVIKSGFLQARNQSADIDDMIWLFNNFRQVSYFKDIVNEWSAADRYIAELHQIGKSVRRENVLQTLTPESRKKYVEQIEINNSRTSYHQRAFAGILGEAFRVITSMLLYLNVLFILVILGSAGWFVSELIGQLVVSQRLIRHQNLAKDEFMSIASHELKTPITSMKASMQILERRTNSSADFSTMRPFVSNANKQVNRLTDLVNELLDVTRIQSGKLVLDNKMTALHELVKETVGDIQHISHHRYTIQELPQAMVIADSRRIQQVMVNLLSNAAKFSPGSTDIVIGMEKEQDTVKFYVRDFGIGIPQTKIPLIFERFYRVEENGNVVQGLGLGLYICSGIVKSHNGMIGADSILGEGSTFWFSLPLAKVTESALIR
ncbi:HAMP domain-containing histidine kinase [Flavihumibacter sp. R14]|nr:HAMP domain-containing histidine kinase [Flavihumibacter soli]